MMRNQKGTSLVSVIVSFAVLMVVLLLLQISITASGRYAARADEVWQKAVDAENKYVNGDGSKKADMGLTMKSDKGNTEFWGSMEIWKTDDGEADIYYIKN